MTTQALSKTKPQLLKETIITSTFFQRGNQVWKKKSNGDVHLFLNTNQFNQDGANEITEEHFDQIRNAHLSRLRRF